MKPVKTGIVCGKAAFRAFFFSSKVTLSLIKHKISNIIMLSYSKVKKVQLYKGPKKKPEKLDETIKNAEKGRKRENGVDKGGRVW